MNNNETELGTAHRILTLNVLAFTVCFAAWMLNGVLVTFLVDNQVFKWSPVQIGWLFGIPVLTGSLFRLPVGILTDKFGGKWVFGLLLLICSVPMYLLSKSDDFSSFALCSLGFGLTGTGFAVGIAFTSVWYPKKWQGTALGIFGMGNAGAAITTLVAPSLLKQFTENGTDLEGWRLLPQLYAAVLFGVGLLFLFFAKNKKPESARKALRGMLSPLKDVRVWRFGLYYYLVFGCFVALSQWLVPYYMNMYSVSLVTAGLLASLFSFPSGVIRALGGWMSDKFGARSVMYWIFGLSFVGCFLLIVPKMEIFSPGEGVMARRGGVVTLVSDRAILIAGEEYPLTAPPEQAEVEESFSVLPVKKSWHEVLVKEGEQVSKRQVIAKGITHIYFQANIWIATFLIFMVGIVWGVGKAAVYKHIPEYYPESVGVVGGMVGVLGGLGGFISPILFGYLLKWTGLWTSMWIFLCIISVVCLLWMHQVIVRMTAVAAPQIMHRMEH